MALTKAARNALAIGALLWASSAHAETLDVKTGAGDPLDRPHTVAEIEVGALALPTAPISPSQRSSDPVFKSGDFTMQTGLHLLFRGGRDWAIGAGAVFSPFPSSDEEYGGLRGLKRTHKRGYLTLNTEGRYIPLHENVHVFGTTFTVEGWVGLTAGMVVVGDRFLTDEGADVPTILGSKEVTIRTEGFTLGLQGGFAWLFSESWLAGFTLRADRWVLPTSPRCSPIGDCSTLTGTLAAFEAGLQVGYRIPL
jgi:hypothetical protein